MEPDEKKEDRNEAGKKSNGADLDKSGTSKKAARKFKFGLRIKLLLIIIPIVSLVIGTMAVFFIIEESALLEEEIVKFAEREIEHLKNTASLSILPGGDILPLLDALRGLNNITSIRYAYILDKNNKVIQYYSEGKKDVTEKKGVVLNDDITIQARKNTNAEKALLKKYPDPKDSDGLIFDFSLPIMHPFYQKQRTGTVRLGFSNEIIRMKIDEIKFTIFLSTLIFLCIAFVGAIIASGMIMRPIKILTKGAAVIGTGDLDYKIDLKRSDELGILANEFNEMTGALKEAKDMEIASRIMEEQLEVAKEIQEGLNPMMYYDKEGIQIKGFTRAAKGVGGDYFDYIDIDKNKVGALISDVSGKGIPASLVMVMIRTVFVTYTKQSKVDCASAVRAVNDSLSADFAIDKFATLFFMIFDRETEELSFSNAGHGPLFCYRSSYGACTVTKLDGMPIGVMEEIEYSQAKVKLSVGDIIVLFTDGIYEMRNSDKEEYGMIRMQKLLMENVHLNAHELIDLIVNDVDEFRGEVPPHDDMTILILKRDS